MGSRYRGPLRAYRIADRRHPIFDGTGAALHGARWTSPGRRVIYAALSFTCAMLERLAQTGTGALPKNQYVVTIDVPEGVEIEEATAADVPGWDLPNQRASRAYGDAWLAERRTAVLVVPSVVSRLDRNALFNQDHPAFGAVRSGPPEPVIWGRRLFRRDT